MIPRVGRIRIALCILDPELYRCFLGRTLLAKKTRALVAHDRTLNQNPREEQKR